MLRLSIAKDEEDGGEELVREPSGGYLKAATGTMESKALEMVLSFPPLHLVIISIARRAVYRVKGE